MRIFRPLNAVDSGSKVLVLRELSITPKKELNEVEIAELANIHQTTVDKCIWSLVREGLVFHHKVGRANVFKLNTKNVLSCEIKKLFCFEDQLKERLINEIKAAMKTDENVILVYLFGSVAKNEDRYDSDVDVFVVAKDKEKFEEKYIGSKNVRNIQDRFDKILIFHVVTEDEFMELTKKKVPLIREVEDTGIQIYGKSIIELKLEES